MPKILKRGRWGFSFIEIIIVMALMGVVAVGVGVLIARGVDFYLDSTDGVDVRKELMFGATRLSRDLADSHIDAVHVEVDGLVFPSIRDGNGHVEQDDRGRVLWQKYICYYLDTSVTPARILRKEADLPRAASGIPHELNPPAGSGEINPPNPMVETPARDVTWFKNNAAIPKNIVARNVVTFAASKDVDLVSFNMEVSISTRRQHLIGMDTKVKPRH
jgi:prepilin-type N-terminal cleavage/methylation domain-containing protein